MTATLGVAFEAGSAVKRILLFTINATVLLLGITCSVLCLYQVKLMPETYDVIVAALLESNLTAATPLPSPAITAIGIRNSGGNTTRSGGSSNGRPRVSRYVGPKKDKSSNQQMGPVYPVTLMENLTSSTETGTTITSYLDVQNPDMTKAVAESQTERTASITTNFVVAKASVSGSNFTVSQVVTATSLMNTMEETIDFGQVLKDRIAELENELRLVQLREKVGKSTEKENQTSTTVSSLIPSPIGKLNFTDIQTLSIANAIRVPLANRPSILIPTSVIQQLTEPVKPWTTSTPVTTKSSSHPASLITTSLSATLTSSTPTALFSPTSKETLAVTLAQPAETTAATSLASTRVVSIARSTTFTAPPFAMSSTSAASPETTSFVSNTIKTAEATTRTDSASTKAATKLPKTTLAFTSTTMPTTFDDVPSTESSKPETSALTDAGEISLTMLNPTASDFTSPKPQLNDMNAFLSTEPQAAFVTFSSEEQVSPTSIIAIANPPSTTGSLVPWMQTATPLKTPVMATSLSSSKENASTSSSMIKTTSQTLPAVNAATSSAVQSSTKSMSTSSTTPSSMGFINLTGVFDSISQLIGQPDLSGLRLRKRSSASRVAPAINSANTLTADHIPIHFEQVFFFVQTSLYVSTAAGLLIFFSSLIGICGGLFRIDGCLKFSVAALVLVIMAEMATIAFIFVAHDKASNRNKNKNFDRDLKLLCELANFCIQPMLLVITGSFLCISVVLQIGSMTLACNLMEKRAETDPDKKMRRMMRSNHSNFQFGAGNMRMNPYSNPMQMPMPYCGGGGYGGMNGSLFPYPSPMMMPMQNMGYYPPVYSGPGQRPIVNIIS